MVHELNCIIFARDVNGTKLEIENSKSKLEIETGNLKWKSKLRVFDFVFSISSFRKKNRRVPFLSRFCLSRCPENYSPSPVPQKNNCVVPVPPVPTNPVLFTSLILAKFLVFFVSSDSLRVKI